MMTSFTKAWTKYMFLKCVEIVLLTLCIFCCFIHIDIKKPKIKVIIFVSKWYIL